MAKLSDFSIAQGFEVLVRYRGRPKGKNTDNFTLEKVCVGSQQHFIGRSKHDKGRVSLAGSTEALGLPYEPKKEQ